jgi:hypothetical protein
MLDRFSLVRAGCGLLLGLSAIPPAALADDAYRISGPFLHANLAIYLVHGKSVAGPVPLTLQEALTKGVVQVEETGSVNDLTIENTGEEPVFVQSGEIVKGGRQDRVFMSSLVLPPHSGSVSIAAYCVEHGRWTARSGEAGDTFASADAALPSRQAKLAMKAPQPADQQVTDGSDTGARQAAIWADVADIQDRLSAKLGAPVASPRSASSLQLSLENDKLLAAQKRYVAALQPVAEQELDIVGYVFAINGKLNSADLYPSNALFRKMWPKLLRASATEAIGDTISRAETPPTSDAVMTFLESAQQGEASKTAVNDSTELETRESDAAVYFETSPSEPALGGWVHRNYLAK